MLMFCFCHNMQNNSPTFTSNIRFVSGAAFEKLKTGQRIGYKHDEPNLIKAKDFYSVQIRTCTGGGLVNPHQEAEGFHLWDDLTNMLDFHDIVVKMFRFVKNPEHGLLVGSKELERSPYSIEQFQNLKKIFKQRVPHLSLFEQHKYMFSETNYQYSLDDDTWTLCTNYRISSDAKFNSIKSVNTLKNCFEKIKIADGDRLFIGQKEILPKDYPELWTEN